MIAKNEKEYGGDGSAVAEREEEAKKTVLWVYIWRRNSGNATEKKIFIFFDV